ncbi:MAG: hypothetical protein WBA57_07905 [Elainellaceae cyanobacterium]
MARYTSLYRSIAPSPNVKEFLFDMLRSCNFDVIYDRGDYLFAREVPGKVDYSKLVTVEVLIDQPIAALRETDGQLHMNVVVKNEELPLQVNNHCRQKFNLVNNAVLSNEMLSPVCVA